MDEHTNAPEGAGETTDLEHLQEGLAGAPEQPLRQEEPRQESEPGLDHDR